MGSILPLAIWRPRSGKLMLAILLLGVVVASVLLASAPIYTRSMADLGLTYVLQKDLRGHQTSRVAFQSVPLAAQDGMNLRQSIEQRIDQRLGWFRSSQSRYLGLGRF